MSRILLVRHCEASGQHGEASLSERGFAQAEALAATLAEFAIERIVSSPYLRARQIRRARRTPLRAAWEGPS